MRLPLSIIIPTYNSGFTIGKCLQSIISQSVSEYEIIIQDGVSADDTLLVVKQIQNLNPSVSIILCSEKDINAYDAMNKGIMQASGQWLYFLGSDDYLVDNDVLHNVFSAIKNYGGEHHLIYGNVTSPFLGSKYDGEFDKHKLLEKNICHQSIFYNQNLFENNNFYNVDYRIAADYEFNLRCFFNRKVKAKYIDLTIAYYSEGGLSSKGDYDKAFHDNYNSIIKKLAYKQLPLKMLKRYCTSNSELLLLLLKRLAA